MYVLIGFLTIPEDAAILRAPSRALGLISGGCQAAWMEETVLTGLYIKPICVSRQAVPVSVLVQPGPQTQERLWSGGHRAVEEATGSGLILFRPLLYCLQRLGSHRSWSWTQPDPSPFLRTSSDWGSANMTRVPWVWVRMECVCLLQGEMMETCTQACF